MRILERLIFPLFIITAAIGLTYWYWTTTPSYTLTQVATSIQNRDVDSFQKYVDIDSIASHGIDDILHGPARSSIFGRFDSMIGAGIIGLFKPQIVDIIKDQVLRFIADGNLQALGVAPAAQAAEARGSPPGTGGTGTAPGSLEQGDEGRGHHRGGGLSGLIGGASFDDTAANNADDESAGGMHGKGKIKHILADYGFSKDGFKGVDYLKTEGQNAFFGLKFHSPKMKKDFILEFKMEDVGGYWRVTELSNLNDLVAAYLDARDS